MNLPLGYQPFHKEKFFNYQLNRLQAVGYARQADIQKAASQIQTREDYVRVFLQLAEEAKGDGRYKNAAFYLRAAEFFAPHTSPQRQAIYQEFHETFYQAFADEGIVRHEVPSITAVACPPWNSSPPPSRVKAPSCSLADLIR